jgi:alkylhydroperoxidase family enzyme
VSERYAELMAALERATLESPAGLDRATRRAAAFGGELPEPLAGYVDTVRRHAYKVVDADVERLRAAGLSEDEIFEATAAAAVGAGLVRLRAGLAALE